MKDRKTDWLASGGTASEWLQLTLSFLLCPEHMKEEVRPPSGFQVELRKGKVRCCEIPRAYFSNYYPLTPSHLPAAAAGPCFVPSVGGDGEAGI